MAANAHDSAKMTPQYQMSEIAQRLLARIVLDRNNGPVILYQAWSAQEIADFELPSLIPDTWLFIDWPEQIIGAENWVQLFRAAGYHSIPYGQPKPTEPLTAYRGATAERALGMSWTTDITRADQFRQRQAWHGPTAIYATAISPQAVLARLGRRGEEPPEIIADPKMLTNVRQHGPMYPQRRRSL